jgi:regulatory protein
VKKAKTAYSYLIALLSKRDYSYHKLRAKCREKGFENEEIEEAISELDEQRYIREDYYIDARVRGLTRKSYGPEYIIQKLKAEDAIDITESEIYSILEESKIDSTELLCEYIERKFSKEQLDSYEYQTKVLPALQRRGFCRSSIHEARQNLK